MNAATKLMTLPLTDQGKLRLGLVLFRYDSDNGSNVGFKEIIHRAKRHDAEGYNWDFENLLPKMSLVNKMVKDSTCPNNLKNRFYTLKHKVIAKLYHYGKIAHVYDEGKYWAFEMTDNISFHQPADRCWWAKPEEKRESTIAEGSSPFDMETYKNCLMTMIYFLETYDDTEI